MGLRGPPKKPAAVKRRQGTYREDRDAAVEVSAALPDQPAWLTAGAQDEWTKRAPQLVAANLLTPLDEVAFALYCQSYDEFVTALKMICENAPEFTTETSNGTLVQHPVVAVLHKAAHNTIQLARQFGMTPSARCGLKPKGTEPDDDPLSQLGRKRAAARAPKPGAKRRARAGRRAKTK